MMKGKTKKNNHDTYTKASYKHSRHDNILKCKLNSVQLKLIIDTVSRDEYCPLFCHRLRLSNRQIYQKKKPDRLK